MRKRELSEEERLRQRWDDELCSDEEVEEVDEDAPTWHDFCKHVDLVVTGRPRPFRCVTTPRNTGQHGIGVLRKMHELWTDDELCDVVLVCGDEGGELVRISAHRVVLAANSTFFKTMFVGHMLEAHAGEVRVQLRCAVARAVVSFCYSGSLAPPMCFEPDLLLAADMLDIPPLASAVSSSLLSNIRPSNVLRAWLAAEATRKPDLVEKCVHEAYFMLTFCEECASLMNDLGACSMDQMEKMLSCAMAAECSPNKLQAVADAWLAANDERKQHRAKLLSILGIPESENDAEKCRDLDQIICDLHDSPSIPRMIMCCEWLMKLLDMDAGAKENVVVVDGDDKEEEKEKTVADRIFDEGVFHVVIYMLQIKNAALQERALSVLHKLVLTTRSSKCTHLVNSIMVSPRVEDEDCVYMRGRMRVEKTVSFTVRGALASLMTSPVSAVSEAAFALLCALMQSPVPSLFLKDGFYTSVISNVTEECVVEVIRRLAAADPADKETFHLLTRMAAVLHIPYSAATLIVGLLEHKSREVDRVCLRYFDGYGSASSIPEQNRQTVVEAMSRWLASDDPIQVEAATKATERLIEKWGVGAFAQAGIFSQLNAEFGRRIGGESSHRACYELYKYVTLLARFVSWEGATREQLRVLFIEQGAFSNIDRHKSDSKLCVVKALVMDDEKWKAREGSEGVFWTPLILMSNNLTQNIVDDITRSHKYNRLDDAARDAIGVLGKMVDMCAGDAGLLSAMRERVGPNGFHTMREITVKRAVSRGYTDDIKALFNKFLDAFGEQVVKKAAKRKSQ